MCLFRFYSTCSSSSFPRPTKLFFCGLLHYVSEILIFASRNLISYYAHQEDLDMENFAIIRVCLMVLQLLINFGCFLFAFTYFQYLVRCSHLQVIWFQFGLKGGFALVLLCLLLMLNYIVYLSVPIKNLSLDFPPSGHCIGKYVEDSTCVVLYASAASMLQLLINFFGYSFQCFLYIHSPVLLSDAKFLRRLPEQPKTKPAARLLDPTIDVHPNSSSNTPVASSSTLNLQPSFPTPTCSSDVRDSDLLVTSSVSSSTSFNNPNFTLNTPCSSSEDIPVAPVASSSTPPVSNHGNMQIPPGRITADISDYKPLFEIISSLTSTTSPASSKDNEAFFELMIHHYRLLTVFHVAFSLEILFITAPLVRLSGIAAEVLNVANTIEYFLVFIILNVAFKKLNHLSLNAKRKNNKSAGVDVCTFMAFKFASRRAAESGYKKALTDLNDKFEHPELNEQLLRQLYLQSNKIRNTLIYLGHADLAVQSKSGSWISDRSKEYPSFEYEKLLKDVSRALTIYQSDVSIRVLKNEIDEYLAKQIQEARSGVHPSL